MKPEDVPDDFYSKVKTVIDDVFPDGLLAWLDATERVPKGELHEAGVKLVLAMMKVEDRDEIPKKDRWRRRRKALHTAARKSTSFAEMVAEMADELHAKQPNRRTSKKLNSVYSTIEGDFQRFRHHCADTAFMIVSDAQVIRDSHFDDGSEGVDEDVDIFSLEESMDLPELDEEE